MMYDMKILLPKTRTHSRLYLAAPFIAEIVMNKAVELDFRAGSAACIFRDSERMSSYLEFYLPIYKRRIALGSRGL